LSEQRAEHVEGTELAEARALIERLTRRLTSRKQGNVDGRLMIIHDGDPLLREAFAALGWHDHHPVE